MQGDKQRVSIYCFDTYAPVVQWSTVIMVLTMVLSKGRSMRQVYYTNEFTQADIKEEVYVNQPKGFTRKDRKDMVLKMFKSLYGIIPPFSMIKFLRILLKGNLNNPE